MIPNLSIYNLLFNFWKSEGPEPHLEYLKKRRLSWNGPVNTLAISYQRPGNVTHIFCIVQNQEAIFCYP